MSVTGISENNEKKRRNVKKIKKERLLGDIPLKVKQFIETHPKALEFLNISRFLDHIMTDYLNNIKRYPVTYEEVEMLDAMVEKDEKKPFNNFTIFIGQDNFKRFLELAKSNHHTKKLEAKLFVYSIYMYLKKNK